MSEGLLAIAEEGKFFDSLGAHQCQITDLSLRD